MDESSCMSSLLIFAFDDGLLAEDEDLWRRDTDVHVSQQRNVEVKYTDAPKRAFSLTASRKKTAEIGHFSTLAPRGARPSDVDESRDLAVLVAARRASILAMYSSSQRRTSSFRRRTRSSYADRILLGHQLFSSFAPAITHTS